MGVEPISIENALTIVAVLYLPWDDKDFNQLRASFAQYRKPVATLMTVVPDLAHVAKIFASVINQASELEQDSAWAVQELYFEAQAEVLQDRPK